MRLAKKKFKEFFPDAKQLRHTVAHAAELVKNEAARARNIFTGIYEDGGLKIVDSELFMSGGLQGRHYTGTLNNTVVKYEISQTTLDQLLTVLQSFRSAFKAASISNF